VRFLPGRSRLVLIGTSAGGLATVLAAAKMPGLAGWIGLDPSRPQPGPEAKPRRNSKRRRSVLLGGASSCNLFGSGRDIARALPHLVRRLALKDASHCDFEDPTTNLCRVLCGRSSAQMQARIRDETVRAAIELLESPRRGTCRQRHGLRADTRRQKRARKTVTTLFLRTAGSSSD
jgi:pimeloyl-ACP methyl ester carboxylesterase